MGARAVRDGLRAPRAVRGADRLSAGAARAARARGAGERPARPTAGSDVRRAARPDGAGRAHCSRDLARACGDRWARARRARRGRARRRARRAPARVAERRAMRASRHGSARGGGLTARRRSRRRGCRPGSGSAAVGRLSLFRRCSTSSCASSRTSRVRSTSPRRSCRPRSSSRGREATSIELGEHRWAPERATLTVYEGPRLREDEIGMGGAGRTPPARAPTSPRASSTPRERPSRRPSLPCMADFKLAGSGPVRARAGSACTRSMWLANTEQPGTARQRAPGARRAGGLGAAARAAADDAPAERRAPASSSTVPQDQWQAVLLDWATWSDPGAPSVQLEGVRDAPAG